MADLISNTIISSPQARAEFLKKRKAELDKWAEHLQVLPTKKLFAHYITPSAECILYPDQGSIHIDTDEFYMNVISKLKEGITTAALFSRITEALNEYFGSEIPNEKAYRNFTRGKHLNISDFKNSNMASGFERSLVTFNLLQMLDIESYLIFSNNKPYVIAESTFRDNSKCYTIYDASVYSRAKGPKIDRIAPHASPITVEEFDSLLYNKDITFTIDVKSSILGVSPENTKIDEVPGFGTISVDTLGLPREQTMFR